MKRIVDDALFLLLIVALGAIVIAFIVPLVVVIAMAFDARDFLAPFPPKEFSLKWFRRLFTNEFYTQGFRYSIIVASITTVVSTAIGVSAAVALDRYEFPGKRMLAALFLSPFIVPAVIIGFALLFAFSLAGIFAGLPRILAGHIIITIPYTIRVTLAGLAGIPKSIHEAALILGANERQAFWSVTLPLLRTSIFASAIFAFVFSIDDVPVAMFLSSAQTYTLPVAMVGMMREQFDLSIAAAAIVLTAIMLFFMMIFDRLLGVSKIFRG